MERLAVPLLKQSTASSCGPAALSMVLKYFGYGVPQRRIINKIGGIKKYGVRTVKLSEFAQELGFKVYCYSYNKKLAGGRATIKKPSKSDIIHFLEKRLPVIVAVDSRQLSGAKGKHSTMGHFIVIVNHKSGKFQYNDPSDRKQHQIKERDLMLALIKNARESSGYLLVLKQ